MITDQQIQELNARALIRGNYQNVASETKGAIIPNSNLVSFAGTSINSSPLRDQCHLVDKQQGYCYQHKGHPILVDLLQPYEINTIIFRLYDKEKVQQDMQVFIQNSVGNEKQLVYDSKEASGLVRISFEPTQVKQIEFFNRGGNTMGQYMHIVMIQAFFAIQ